VCAAAPVADNLRKTLPSKRVDDVRTRLNRGAKNFKFDSSLIAVIIRASSRIL
jgi:hypothetical protein